MAQASGILREAANKAAEVILNPAKPRHIFYNRKYVAKLLYTTLLIIMNKNFYAVLQEMPKILKCLLESRPRPTGAMLYFLNYFHEVIPKLFKEEHNGEYWNKAHLYIHDIPWPRINKKGSYFRYESIKSVFDETHCEIEHAGMVSLNGLSHLCNLMINYKTKLHLTDNQIGRLKETMFLADRYEAHNLITEARIDVDRLESFIRTGLISFNERTGDVFFNKQHPSILRNNKEPERVLQP